MHNTAWLSNVLVLIFLAQPTLCPLSSQDTKFAQQDGFVTQLATIRTKRLIHPSGRLLNRLMGLLVVVFSLGKGAGDSVLCLDFEIHFAFINKNTQSFKRPL